MSYLPYKSLVSTFHSVGICHFLEIGSKKEQKENEAKSMTALNS